MRQFSAIVIGLLIIAQSCDAQVKARTKGGTFKPPVLNVVVSFRGPSGSNVLQAGEAAELVLAVSNSGEGKAKDVVAKLITEAHYSGIAFDSTVHVGEIAPHGQARANLKIAALNGAGSQTVRMRVEAYDSFRHSVASTIVEFSTREFRPPQLRVTGKWVRLQKEPLPRPINGETKVKRGDTVTVLLRVQNVGKGRADSLRASLTMKDEARQVVYVGKPLPFNMKDLPPDSADTVSFPFVVGEQYASDALSLTIRIAERHPEFSAEQRVELGLSSRQLSFEERVSALLQEGAYDSAIAACLIEIANKGGSATLYFSLGRAYSQKGEDGAGIQNYQKAAQLGHVGAQQWLDANTKSKSVTTVSYKKFAQNPFAGDQYPIGLGILRFSSSRGNYSELTKKVLDTLKSRSAVLEKFTLFPYSSLEEQKATLQIGNLDPTDKQVLAKLDKFMDIKFVVYGVVTDETLPLFTMDVVRTADGKKVFSQQFRQSSNSTPINDAVLLFQSFRVPVYKNERVLQIRR